MAMVLRYWGDRQAQPGDFAALLDRSASGIRTDVLTADIIRRGWQAFPIDAGTGASSDWMREQIDRGRPIVALIEVRPNAYHDLVIVGWTAGQVIAHDPAGSPFTVMSRQAFDHSWAATGRWAALVLPATDGPAPLALSPSRPTASPTRSGELLTVAWRWWTARPRLAMSLAVPAGSWLHGIATVEASWERQSYATPAIRRDERRHAGLRLAGWASGTLRWSAGAGFDRWANDSHVSADGAVDLRLFRDRVSIGGEASAWTPV